MTKLRIALATAVVAFVACAPAASADSVSPTWNCRASTAYLINNLLPAGDLGLILPDPIVANGNPDPDHPDNAQCVTDTPVLHHINVGGTGGLLDADAAAANTTINPEIAPARDQTAFAAANTTNIALRLSAGLVVKIAALGSQASATCIAGKPVLQGSSTAVHIEINGQLLPIDDGLTQLATALAPLAPLVKISVNKQTITGTADTDTQELLQQALVVQLLNFDNTTKLTLVLGEAKVRRQGRTCDGADLPGTPGAPQTPPNTPPTTNPGPTGPTTPSVVFVPVQVPVTTGSSTATNTKIELNGTNGGCGTVKMFFDKNKSKTNRTFDSVFGQRVVTRGRLISCSGKPIIGGRVDVYHLIRGQKHRLRKTGIRSRAGGLVTLILPLNLTSRKIFFEYRGNLASSHVNSRSTLTLNVHDKNTGKIISKLPPGQPKPRF